MSEKRAATRQRYRAHRGDSVPGPGAMCAMTRLCSRGSLECLHMAAGDAGSAGARRSDSSGPGEEHQVAAKQGLAMVETAGADDRPAADASAPPMAVSIAGVSTACSKHALVTSAKAVRKTLTPE